MTDKRTARERAILIMAAGTAADTLRLPTGERIGGLWTFADHDREMARISEIDRLLSQHGLTLRKAEPPLMAADFYKVKRYLEIVPA